MRWSTGVGLALLATALLAAAACGTEPVGVEACKKVERVRCESAQGCGISLENPVHRGDSPSDNVGACIRYYDDQCLHGIVSTVEPAPQAVDACVDAIINGSCTAVSNPETEPACSWLIPPAPPPEPAPAPADAGDG